MARSRSEPVKLGDPSVDDARNLVQRLTYIYLTTYLLVGGLALLVLPELTLRLLLQTAATAT